MSTDANRFMSDLASQIAAQAEEWRRRARNKRPRNKEDVIWLRCANEVEKIIEIERLFDAHIARTSPSADPAPSPATTPTEGTSDGGDLWARWRSCVRAVNLYPPGNPNRPAYLEREHTAALAVVPIRPIGEGWATHQTLTAPSPSPRIDSPALDELSVRVAEMRSGAIAEALQAFTDGRPADEANAWASSKAFALVLELLPGSPATGADEGEGALTLGHEDRFHLWSFLFSIQQECEGRRYGQPGYDMTLDHIYEQVTSALAYFEPAADAALLAAPTGGPISAKEAAIVQVQPRRIGDRPQA